MLRAPIHAGFAILASIALLTGCGKAHVNASAPSLKKFSQTGVASWYGPGYEGKRTASGEVFHMSELTAAHRNLPFDTRVRVTNLSNKKQVDVRINDRGPFVQGRIIDLSREAAQRIDLIGPGTAKVKIQAIKK